MAKLRRKDISAEGQQKQGTLRAAKVTKNQIHQNSKTPPNQKPPKVDQNFTKKPSGIADRSLKRFRLTLQRQES
ncbi:hypothetical protein HYFRA_00005145 [Hymenoscyphus fraxineus]|uniref:Uncharacterized protein n=1 Tax=Hymenoscyphus fraxineus TaxID=746836 RepID=A0A9N9LD80_9HELO|nr:hypothetical protein HYFRA_00005145 [Hymenoscyphus fraxineus]